MSKMLLSDKLEGFDLALVNLVLMQNGCNPVGVCEVGQMMQALLPMEVGKFARIIKLISNLLEAAHKVDETEE